MDDDFDDFGDIDESALAMTLEQEELESNLANRHIVHGNNSNVYNRNSFAGQSMSAPRNPFQQVNGLPFGGNRSPAAPTNSITTTSHPPSTPAGLSTGLSVGKGVITAEDYEDFGDWTEGELASAFDDDKFALPQGSATSSGSSLNQQQPQPPRNHTTWRNRSENVRVANLNPFQAQQRPQQQETQPAKLFPIFGGAKKQQTLPFVSSSGNNIQTSLQRTSPATLNENRNIIQRQGSFAQPLSNSATALSGTLSSSSTTSSGTLNKMGSNLSTRSDIENTAFNPSSWRPPTSAASAPEPLTHHTIDYEAIKTWQYPINYPKRDYQFNIIRHALFTNTLVSLPTGLGKTFIAAVVMLNYFRWFPKSKIIFMAPTKPLVNQQIEACFNICGIPQDATAEMTGATQAEARRAQWREKRLFFCTPHIVKNDISSGICPAEDIVCLVIDEAHKASGNYAFATVIRALHPLNTSVRVLALSATPGTELNKVQQLVQTLKVARIEARTEDSLDLNKYMFKREVKEVVVPCGPEIAQISQRFLKLIQPFVDKLAQTGVIEVGTRAESLSRYGLTTRLKGFMHNNHMASARKSAIYSGVRIVGGLVAAYDSLMVQGIKLFFSTMEPPESTGTLNTSRPTIGSGAPGSGSWSGPSGRGGWGEQRGRGGRGRGGGRGSKRKTQGRGSDDDEGGSEYGEVEEDKPTASIQAVQHLPEFGRLMNDIRVKMRHSDFVTHPKVTRLEQVIVQHFVDHQEEAKDMMRAKRYAREGSPTPSQSNDTGANGLDDLDEAPQTRVIVFANLREVVVEIARVLERHRPLIKVQNFVGQAAANGKKGISQKDQKKVLADFHKGDHNVLVATSIGEEGLDIGDVDLIVCYDVQSSPTRMIQRMGRTGRKRKGRIVLLMADGRETNKYKEAVTRYKRVQNAIARGQITMFPFPPRILPPDASPACDLVHIDIPDYINPDSKKKSGKTQSKKSLGAGSALRAGYLDAEEEVRFQKQYWLPRRTIRKITLESSLARQRQKRLHGPGVNIDADTTSIVGHSDTTSGYLEIIDRISTHKDARRESTELDSYSKRMLELLDLSPPPSDQPMFSSLKRSILQKEARTIGNAQSRSKTGTRASKSNSEYDSDNYRVESGRYHHGSLDDSDLDQIHSGLAGMKDPKRRYQHDKDSYASLSEDPGDDNADLPTGPVPRPKAKRAKKGDSTSGTLDAMFRQGIAASRKDTGGIDADKAARSVTKELPSISDDDVDMEIMGGLGTIFKLDISPIRLRRRVISEDEASDAGAPSPAINESVFDYDFPMDDDWGLHDGDWDAPAGVDTHGDHYSLKGGFDFSDSRRRCVAQNWYTSDRSDEESDDPEGNRERLDESNVEDEPMLMVLPPVPPSGRRY
ncbi:hypothetical protein BGZ81_009090 [Podila clonocystis]|nr:hypothetical protein BGZ81_009090 [Podila clonocystis]